MKPRIGIIIGSVRGKRFGIKPASYVADVAARRGDIDVVLVDLKDFHLGIFGQEGEGAELERHRDAAARWSEQLESLDGFIFVTPEYNHGIPGGLKNAIDQAGVEPFRHKPATFVGYGPIGSARAIEGLRLILIGMEVAPLRKALHIGMEPFMAIRDRGAAFDDFPFIVDRTAIMLDELVWWTNALVAAREASNELVTS